MKTVICPKCNKVIAVPDHQDYVICCNEVIYVPYETHDCKDEDSTSIRGEQERI